MPGWERDDLVRNLIDLVGQCDRHVQERIVELFAKCDLEYGRRVADGVGLLAPLEAFEASA
jgi:catalase